MLHSPVTVKRAEGYEVLDSVIMSDGSTINLGEQMRNAAKACKQNGSKGNDSAIENLKSLYGNTILKANQERFMSTSLAGKAPFSEKPVIWEMTVEKGSKGVFLETANVNSGLETETEFLLQKDSVIEILGFDFDYTKHKWIVYGKVSN